MKITQRPHVSDTAAIAPPAVDLPSTSRFTHYALQSVVGAQPTTFGIELVHA